ncbi:MAG: DNA topoisomerase 3 [Firmicutes bacterium]|nr:DNA topoisomerase 3 [Bacillota bacterium]
MKLVLCEKPSVGNTVAKVLGVKSRKDGYIECGDHIVSWCIGHLVNLALPEEYSKEYKKWDKLPILPTEWKYNILSGTKKQFDVIRKLMNRKDVTGIVCATDAGREGELIFRLVYNEAECKKPIERLWISSLEDTAIKSGFASLHKGSDFDNLYRSALCRERADWLIGMNLSRFFTVRNDKVFSIGRVQTPTLAMIAARDKEIMNFKKGYFYTVDLDCNEFVAKSDKIENKSTAEKICAVCDTARAVSVKRENKFTAPPKLYDLTTLQREANKHFGFTAQQTLNIVQKLYEAKLVTYPRTDSRFLTEDMEDTAQAVINTITNTLDYKISETPNIKPVMNNKKVTDHHAIIPTVNLNKTTLESTSSDERKVLELIALRLLTATAPKEEYESVKVGLESGGEKFTVTGKTVINDGFKAVEKQFKTGEEKETALPDIAKGNTYDVSAKVTEHETQPPKAYTEDTLLSAMEKAGGKDFDENVERTGLGTPATRASIIETLVKRKYIERKGKSLVSTALGNELINAVPETLTSPAMTVEWENELSKIAQGKADNERFMKNIEEFIKETIKN